MMEPDLFRRSWTRRPLFAYDMAVHHREVDSLHPEFAPLLAYAARKGIRTETAHQRGAIDAEKAEAVVRSGLDYLSFSFDPGSRRRRTRESGSGSFEKTLRKHLGFLQVKKSLGSRKPYTVIEVIDFPSMGTSIRTRGELFVETFRDLLLDGAQDQRPPQLGRELRREQGTLETALSFRAFPWYSSGDLLGRHGRRRIRRTSSGAYPGERRDASLMESGAGTLRRLRKTMLARRVEHYSACSACDVICRPTFAGVPTPNLRRFLTDQILGSERRRRRFGTGRRPRAQIVGEHDQVSGIGSDCFGDSALVRWPGAVDPTRRNPRFVKTDEEILREEFYAFAEEIRQKSLAFRTGTRRAADTSRNMMSSRPITLISRRYAFFFTKIPTEGSMETSAGWKIVSDLRSGVRLVDVRQFRQGEMAVDYRKKDGQWLIADSSHGL